MKIYLELLIFIIPMFIFIFWYLWNAWSRKRLLKKYNPEDDLGKLAEEKRLAEIEIHNGKKNKTKVGRESSRGFGRGIFRSSRNGNTRTKGSRSSSDQESIVPSRRSELPYKRGNDLLEQDSEEEETDEE